MTVPLHLGLTPWLAPIGRRADELSRQAELAEQWGYESFWLPENHFGEGAIPEPMMLLVRRRGATRSIRLGTTSYLLPLRHPLASGRAGCRSRSVVERPRHPRCRSRLSAGAVRSVQRCARGKAGDFADCLATMRRGLERRSYRRQRQRFALAAPGAAAAPPDLGGCVRAEGVESGRYARLTLSRVADGIIRGAGSQLRAPCRGVRAAQTLSFRTSCRSCGRCS